MRTTVAHAQGTSLLTINEHTCIYMHVAVGHTDKLLKKGDGHSEVGTSGKRVDVQNRKSND